MPAISEQAILEKLKSVHYPGFSRDIVSFGLVQGISVEGSHVGVRLKVTTSDSKIGDQLRVSATEALKSLEGIDQADVWVEMTAPPPSQTPGGPLREKNKIPHVQHILAVASGKGGVGKSTIAANLALALHQQGARVGLCDCDIYGPSIALMFGVQQSPQVNDRQEILPITAHGIRLMSMGFFLDDNSPAILRGPMVTRYTQQFLQSVLWGHLDYLILDLPPGTGDIQLTIVQTVALSGAIIVTTPQEVALIDARKACAMFKKVNVDILGIIENMSYFLCPQDRNRYPIFGEGGGEREAKRQNVPLLAQIPLEIDIQESGNKGLPFVLESPQRESSLHLQQAATDIIKKTGVSL